MWLSVRPGRDRHAAERVLALGLVDEDDARRAHRELVAVVQVVVPDALAAQERPVQRLEIAQHEAAVGGPLDLRVLLRDDPIEDLDRVVGMAADRVERSELELLSLIPGNDDQLGHAVCWAPGWRAKVKANGMSPYLPSRSRDGDGNACRDAGRQCGQSQKTAGSIPADVRRPIASNRSILRWTARGSLFSRLRQDAAM